MNTKTLPADDLPALLNRCATIKQQVVEFAQNNYRAEIQARIAERSLPTAALSEWDVAGAIDDVIHQHDETGYTLLEDFADNAPDLSEEDRAIVLGWRESMWGVFEVRGHEGPVLDVTNLVDGLDYRVATTLEDPKAIDQLARSGFLITRVDRLGDMWTFSGMQSVMKPTERRLAFGMAAKFAQETPALLFRNPKNLEKGRELDRAAHARFMEHFGGAWIIDTPRELERRANEYFQSGGASQGASLRLNETLLEAETVGLFSDPVEGLNLYPNAGSLIRAFEDPTALKQIEVLDVVLDCLETPGNSPSVFRILAEHDPAKLDAMMAVIAEEPEFSWAHDGEALIRELNPAFFEREIWPSMLPLGAELEDGLLAWREREREVSPKRAVKPKQKDKRKRAKAARRKNRR